MNRVFVKKTILTILAVMICVAVAFGLSGCGSNKEPEAEPTPTPTAKPTPPPSTPEPTPEPVNLVPYNGIVEHIFFHEILAFPELAFGSSREENFDEFYVTVSEFTKILASLHENNYVLVNLNDVWSEYLADSGFRLMRQNTMMIPEGKKPLVISFDDMNFRQADIPYGTMSRYYVGDDGEIWAEGTSPDGSTVRSKDLTAITILENFIKENPDFSHNGAKGLLSVSGYDGILGYRVNFDRENDTEDARLFRMQEIARVKPVIKKLKDNGWYFGSHSYGRIPFASSNLEKVQADAERWLEEIGSLVGETTILTYPYGSRLDGKDQEAPGPAFKHYIDIGFRYFASLGYESFVQIKSDKGYNVAAVIMDRISIDGKRMRHSRNRILKFFDPIDVFDPLRPEVYGTSWED